MGSNNGVRSHLQAYQGFDTTFQVVPVPVERVYWCGVPLGVKQHQHSMLLCWCLWVRSRADTTVLPGGLCLRHTVAGVKLVEHLGNW
jgi:hypothetical protein